jgi:hypothetical protein
MTTTTPHAKWITYLVFQGIGAGASFQGPIISVRAALTSRPKQISVGVSLVAFFQYFGAAVFQSMDLAIFQNKLVRSLKEHASLDQDQVQILLDAGSGQARNATREHFPERLEEVLWSYNNAIITIFVSITFQSSGKDTDIETVSMLHWRPPCLLLSCHPASNGIA